MLICTVLAACSGNEGTGTVIYSEAGTGHVRAYDVASASDWLIDGSGAFGSLTIAADRQHVAYVGADGIVRVADLQGHVQALQPPNGVTSVTGCVPGPTWGPNDSLAYCIYDQGFSSYGVMAAPGAPVRKILATELAISSDASTIVYHRRDADPMLRGDVVVENADGSDQRVLQSSIIEIRFAFTPDGQHVAAVAEHPGGFRVVMHALGDGTTTDLGIGDLPRPIAGGSIFSPDHSEMLAVLGNELVALQLTTGATRHFATLADGVTIGHAAFIDADHVIYRRLETTTPPYGDVVESSQSLRVASSSGELTVMPDTSLCDVRAIAIDVGFSAVECTNATLVSFDGTVRASTDARAARGISADGGLVTLDDDGTVAFVSTDGHPRALATAMPRSELTGALRGPLAAYAP